MCGICGFTQAEEKDRPILKAMCDIMAHRGPDGEGQYIDQGIALGHRRLSLIDLEGGSQPMVRATGDLTSPITSPAVDAAGHACSSPEEMDAKGDYVIVFNGEIYNYADLRKELEVEGWTFEKNSDTEVLLVAYIAWGETMLNRLRGMFAFAIWNRTKQELFCARDFFGIKPFYYTQVNGQFIFASEIKCILEHPAYQRELNEEALAQYLCFQFSALPETFFKGVFKLLQGHCMTVHADGSVTTRRYWQPTYHFDNTRSETDTMEAIHAAMQESVHYHNVADVEVGSFLSSGIDSSYLAATLAQENPDIHTFTVGFSLYQGDRDEISWARELAEKLGIQNDYKHIGEEEYWESLERVQWHMDEPSADPSAVSLYFVDQLAAKQVKAVLSGEGADEFFGGYRIYQTPLANRKLSWVPKGILHAASGTARKLNIRGANYLERASERVEDWYYTNANGVAFSPKERAHLLKNLPDHLATPQELTAPVYAEVASLDEATRMQYTDLWFWLTGDILLKTDKMSMAHSLESRVPFLDKKVFELSATIPTPLKVSDSQTKIALRQAAERAIPTEWAQKEKLGFPTPVIAWLREDKYVQRVREAFTSATAQQFFHTEMLLSLLEEHTSGAKDNSRKIWIVYMFLVWYKIYFVDKSVPPKPAMR